MRITNVAEGSPRVGSLIVQGMLMAAARWTHPMARLSWMKIDKHLGEEVTHVMGRVL